VPKLSAAQAAEIFGQDRPEEMTAGEFGRRLGLLLPALPAVVEGHAALKAEIARNLEELDERLELIGLRERRDRALAIEESLVDVGAEGMKRLRYGRENDRAHHEALRQLRALQEMRLKYGDALGEAVEAEADDRSEPNAPGDAAAQPARAVEAEAATRSEANATTQERQEDRGTESVTGHEV
jgi:hypothetical protein